MQQINVASQLLGSAQGHAVNVAVAKPLNDAGQALEHSLEKLGLDFAKSEAATTLTNLGYAPTLDGAVSFIDAKLDAAINASGLSAVAKADLVAVMDNLIALVRGKLPQVDL